MTQIVLKMDARSASNLRCLTSPAYTASVAKSGVITPKWRLWTPLWRHKIWSGVNPPKFKNVASFDDLIENVWFVASSAQIVAPFAQIMAIPNFLWKNAILKILSWSKLWRLWPKMWLLFKVFLVAWFLAWFGKLVAFFKFRPLATLMSKHELQNCLPKVPAYRKVICKYV